MRTHQVILMPKIELNWMSLAGSCHDPKVSAWHQNSFCHFLADGRNVFSVSNTQHWHWDRILLGGRPIFPWQVVRRFHWLEGTFGCLFIDKKTSGWQLWPLSRGRGAHGPLWWQKGYKGVPCHEGVHPRSEHWVKNKIVRTIVFNEDVYRNKLARSNLHLQEASMSV